MKGPYIIRHDPIGSQSPLVALISKAEPKVAIDPITLMINECMTISSAMRKMTRWPQSGVAAILGTGDFFGEDDPINHLASNLSNNSRSNLDNPLLSSFLQLRTILTECLDLYAIDSLTLLQPFLLVVKSSSISGNITALSLNSISKFLDYDIVSARSKNIQSSLIQIISSLTHCRFEAADQNSDDSVLLKVLRLLEYIICSPLSAYLPNEVISEVVQTCLSLACNKKRSEVLRRAAEMAMFSITVRLFTQLRHIEPESVEEIQTDFLHTRLPEDVIGGTELEQSKLSTPQLHSEEDLTKPAQQAIENGKTPNKEEDKPEEPFGIVCITEFLGILISMIAPSNQYQHMESTRVFAFSLINTAIEVSGLDVPKHVSLMGLIADPISKHVLQTITTTDSPPLLQASLQLFSTIAIVLGRQLKSQIELTFTLLFKAILPDVQNTNSDNFKGDLVTNGVPASKEKLIESLSLLWTRSPVFFTHLFIDYDCDFDRSDLSTKIIKFLCQLSLPESALSTTENVPPICLEGIFSFINGVNDRIKAQNIDPHQSAYPTLDLIENRKKKTAFIRCTERLNTNPKEGIEELAKHGFISNENDIDELATFFFTKSGRLNKKMLGEFLAKPSNTGLLKSFIHLFDFEHLRVDEALRLLLRTFRLPGESQQIERIVELFAERYVNCQEESGAYIGDLEDKEVVRPDRDSVFVLSYSVIMLNTDLHNPQVKKQMLLEEYRKNLRGVYNGKDFPEWYLAKIYLSIRDREIIMPEEHHGTNKWFDDAWHNLISSSQHATQEEQIFSPQEICQFDRVLFENIVDDITKALIQVFKEATDDHVITRLMSSIDKCANICMFYNMELSIDKLIGLLADLTSLADINDKILAEEPRERIPITQIKIDKKEEAITVSEMAVWFGKDFKAQLSMVVLFRLIKKIESKVTSSWDKIVKIILTLFENCLVNPNLFVDFQSKLRLGPLPKVKPRYIINRAKLTNSGLLSTFSSFLKGYSDEPPEPNDQEIESTLSTMDCISSINIPSVFTSISKSSDLKSFIDLLLKTLPEYNDSTKRFYESEALFLYESIICFSLIIGGDEDLAGKVLSKVSTENISKKGQIRVVTYKVLLSRNHRTDIDTIISEINGFDREVLNKNGALLVLPLISLADSDSWCCKKVLNDAGYWNALRSLASIQVFAKEILDFVSSLVMQSIDEVTPTNYLSILGLLDEISSLGAIGSQWEQDSQNEKQKGFYTSLIETSKSSVALTTELSSVSRTPEFTGEYFSYSLMQALAHQCFNPCREIRNYSIGILQVNILSTEADKDLTPEGIFEYVLFPLLAEISKTEVLQTDNQGFMKTLVDVIVLNSKVFLKFSTAFQSHNLYDIWLKILDNFVKFTEISEKYKGKLKESGSEILKNMILVMQANDLILQDSDVWNETWKKIRPVYPHLKEEMEPQERFSEEKVAQEKAAEVENNEKNMDENKIQEKDSEVRDTDNKVSLEKATDVETEDKAATNETEMDTGDSVKQVDSEHRVTDLEETEE